jgi:S-adenosylmethionine hydrolase
MIVLFTDFGLTGPYLGQVRAVLCQRAPQVPVIDLFADAPVHNPKASAYLLAAYAKGFPQGTVFLAVVDPGVGTEMRQPVILKADGHWYVGPDNGLFNVIAARAQRLEAWHVSWRPAELSASFHGRDLFAPLAADLACGQLPRNDYLLPVNMQCWGEELPEVIYVDHFGNLITGIRAAALAEGDSLSIGTVSMPRVGTFADVPLGSPLCYENANGLLEVSVNQGRAEHYFKASLGTPVVVESSP